MKLQISPSHGHYESGKSLTAFGLEEQFLEEQWSGEQSSPNYSILDMMAKQLINLTNLVENYYAWNGLGKRRIARMFCHIDFMIKSGGRDFDTYKYKNSSFRGEAILIMPVNSFMHQI